jgi:hypothetical protein
METRTVTQVKIYKLVLNRMTSAKIEYGDIVLLSDDKERLISYYESQKCEPYRDANWSKSFKQGSPLEWYNPVYNIPTIDECFGHGIYEQWIDIDIFENEVVHDLRYV